MPGVALLWYRRDLRLHDHPALQAALASAAFVVPVYVLDPRLLDWR
jgi:deoxyribodipyrimidine photo-lyase